MSSANFILRSFGGAILADLAGFGPFLDDELYVFIMEAKVMRDLNKLTQILP
jgi:hypothetical protein